MNNLFSWYVPILLYHEISSDDSTKEGSDSISLEHFERQMRYLYEHGYQCLSLAEYLGSAQQGTANGRKAFVLTFANASQWGNNAYIAPQAIPQTGRY